MEDELENFVWGTFTEGKRTEVWVEVTTSIPEGSLVSEDGIETDKLGLLRNFLEASVWDADDGTLRNNQPLYLKVIHDTSKGRSIFKKYVVFEVRSNTDGKRLVFKLLKDSSCSEFLETIVTDFRNSYDNTKGALEAYFRRHSVRASRRVIEDIAEGLAQLLENYDG